MDLLLGFVTWICLNLNWLLAMMGVMHEADDAYSIRSTWSCYWLDQFLTLALNILILSIFYISMDLSTNYFAHFSGCWASFVCSCQSILECCVTFSGVKLSIRSFVLFMLPERKTFIMMLGALLDKLTYFVADSLAKFKAKTQMFVEQCLSCCCDPDIYAAKCLSCNVLFFSRTL